jgi:hypothetical protein
MNKPYKVTLSQKKTVDGLSIAGDSIRLYLNKGSGILTVFIHFSPDNLPDSDLTYTYHINRRGIVIK